LLCHQNSIPLGTGQLIQQSSGNGPSKITTLIIEEFYRGALCGAEHYRAASSYP
jgi:hypothetical protein